MHTKAVKKIKKYSKENSIWVKMRASAPEINTEKEIKLFHPFRLLSLAETTSLVKDL